MNIMNPFPLHMEEACGTLFFFWIILDLHIYSINDPFYRIYIGSFLDICGPPCGGTHVDLSPSNASWRHWHRADWPRWTRGQQRHPGTLRPPAGLERLEKF